MRPRVNLRAPAYDTPSAPSFVADLLRQCPQSLPPPWSRPPQTCPTMPPTTSPRTSRAAASATSPPRTTTTTTTAAPASGRDSTCAPRPRRLPISTSCRPMRKKSCPKIQTAPFPRHQITTQACRRTMITARSKSLSASGRVAKPAMCRTWTT